MIIGLHGRKQSGKDTIARYLISEYGFTKLAFADKLKEAVANLFGMSLEEVDQFKEVGIDDIPLVEINLQIRNTTEWCFSWREFLQRFGTEMGRNTFGEDFWVEIWHKALMEIGSSTPVVVTDVRFENEAACVLVEGGWMVEVTRPGYISDGHASEEPLRRDLIDAWIDNNGTIEDLFEDVDQLVEDIKSGRIDHSRVSDGY